MSYIEVVASKQVHIERKKEKERTKCVCICTTNLLLAVISCTPPYVVELCRYYMYYPILLSFDRSERMNERGERERGRRRSKINTRDL